MEKHQIQNLFNIAKPFICIILLQIGYAGMYVIAKAALDKEMSNYVLIVYRLAIASLVIAPFAVILDKKVRPKMTFSIFMKLAALGALEPVINQNLFVLGIKYTTPTFAAAMANMIPAITFILACILRLEKIKIKSIHSQAKIVGTLTTISGAMVMTLMKGPIIGLFGTHKGNNHNEHDGGANTHHTIKGAVMITIGCFCYSCFIILQTITLETYPAELSLTAWICLLGAIEGSVVALIAERSNFSVWSMKWDIKLLAVIYSAIICSGLAYYLQGIVMKSRGPVFVTAFSPLGMVIVAIMSSLFLAEQLYLGRLIGAIVIVLGLYLVLWGKSIDYNPPSPVTKNPISLTEQIPGESNTKKEHSIHEIITIKNSGTKITTRDEQV